MLKKFCFLFPILLSSCGIFKSKIPQPKNEFRGFWVATVVNIDWPKNGNDPIAKQKADYLELLDFYEDLKFNAAIVQVRAAGDAFYESDFAPWSRFLTGQEGTPPEGNAAILEWMIDETHSRGMEFHAWLNPYRATFDLKTAVLSDEHDFNTHPEWILKYGKKFYYDPGLPEVRQHMVSIIDEIVAKYDIDAIHFDDYFYPNTIKDEVFQDSISFYNCGLTDQSLEDWRRSNIDSLIKNSHDIIKKRKPWVQFGVSPFGVWKNNSTDPKGSDTKAGQTTYDNLYADPLLWMEKGWLDYIVPQVYWSMDLTVASHRKIVDWWSNNSANTHLYIGNAPYKIRNNGDKAWNKKKELANQISYAREKKAVDGNVFFSAKSLMTNNSDVVKHLKKRLYKKQALPPITSKSQVSKKHQITLRQIEKKEDYSILNFDGLEKIYYVLIYSSGKTLNSEYPTKKLLARAFVTNDNQISLSTEIQRKKQAAFIFVDKFGHKSEPKIIHLKQTN